jgi:hypothetical protein
MPTSSDFAQNPIGTFFDPARVYDEFKSGANFKNLQKTIRAGAYLPNPIPEIGLERAHVDRAGLAAHGAGEREPGDARRNRGADSRVEPQRPPAREQDAGQAKRTGLS